MQVPYDLALLRQTGVTWLTEDHGKAHAWPDWLSALDCGKFFIKPVSGNHGRHAGRLDINGDVLRFNGRELDPGRARQALLAGPGDFLLQQWIDQHPDMSIHSDRTVNTIRALTVRLGPDKVIFFHAVMRNGRTDRYLDNFHAGGIAVRVDVESGITMDNGVQLRPQATLKHHPDSNKPLAGLPIPYFEELKALLTKAHAMFPGLRSVGWDVAVSPEGPIIIEGNLDWDVEIHAFCDPNFRSSLSSLLRGLP
jgi:hypothetical protein